VKEKEEREPLPLDGDYFKKANYLIFHCQKDGDEKYSYPEFQKSMNKKIEDLVKLTRSQWAHGRGVPPGKYKVILIEGLDYIVPGVQQFIYKFLAENEDTLRFLFTLDDPKKVIDKLHKKCDKKTIKLKKLTHKTYLRKILRTLQDERMGYEKPALRALLKMAHGDLSTMFRLLQQVWTVYGLLKPRSDLWPPPHALSRYTRSMTLSQKSTCVNSSLHRFPTPRLRCIRCCWPPTS
jgi:DNA polymerase III delta prime subunit